MSLSKRVIETLIDLVEIKLSCIEVYDRDDTREVAALEQCRVELQALLRERAAPSAPVVDFEQASRRRVAV